MCISCRIFLPLQSLRSTITIYGLWERKELWPIWIGWKFVRSGVTCSGLISRDSLWRSSEEFYHVLEFKLITSVRTIRLGSSSFKYVSFFYFSSRHVLLSTLALAAQTLRSIFCGASGCIPDVNRISRFRFFAIWFFRICSVSSIRLNGLISSAHHIRSYSRRIETCHGGQKESCQVNRSYNVRTHFLKVSALPTYDWISGSHTKLLNR